MPLLLVFSFFGLIHCFSEAKFSSGYFFFAFSFDWIDSLFSSQKVPPSSYSCVSSSPLSFPPQDVQLKAAGTFTSACFWMQESWGGIPVTGHQLPTPRTLASLYRPLEEMSTLRAQIPQRVFDWFSVRWNVLDYLVSCYTRAWLFNWHLPVWICSWPTWWHGQVVYQPAKWKNVVILLAIRTCCCKIWQSVALFLCCSASFFFFF